MAARRGRRVDLWVGIVLGLVLGVAIVAVFVFVFSEETVDAPRLDQNRAPTERPADR
ncbi:MAG TPA: hypothetical protein VHJ54_10315 [Solirubrobacterales bacterium]|jgi:Mg/Co/Ni transporter MgtE|nr:hypothetical protein [Solirubrobacterales bacterium]